MLLSADGLIRPSRCCPTLRVAQWWIRQLPCPRDVEAANHYLVVHTGQAEFKMRPLFKWAYRLKIYTILRKINLYNNFLRIYLHTLNVYIKFISQIIHQRI